ncbi:hypothetical protein [Desulforhopalus singaporensis]|uniref:DUF2993 domain-containing protein n=1 Tax=Desulforhopalus singaporensis TaxID=91360 RepID=A0A1H0M2X6_9BACT|nr:hypothetical protein [Desulforhopalus singaporensis]SDO74641.1 hypothetical protein SAMN05660330_00958 [Desulforhopalus singaporensis]
MKKIRAAMAAFILLTIVIAFPAHASENIILEIPQSVIARTTRALLPYDVDTHSKSIDGKITIIDISKVQLEKDQLSCRLHMAGSNLALVTDIAGHQIKLKVGAVEINFHSEARLRFDRNRQKLFVRPFIKDLTTTGDGINDEIGRTLVSLFNGREFPLAMQKLEPLIVEAGAKTVAIDTRIDDIKASRGKITLRLAPVITAK